MDSEYIKNKISELQPWYQQININEIITTKLDRSNEKVWSDVKTLITNIDGMRFLDLGCNAGFYSCMLAINGAKEVIGIEVNNLYHKQSLFLKEYFECKHSKKLPLILQQRNISSIKFDEIGKFDYVLALSIIYFIGRNLGGKYSEGAFKEQERVVGELCKITDNVIVRTRNKIKTNSIDFYTEMFNKFNFEPVNIIKRKRPIVLYSRRK
jgi:SAM-dependent methyltransferase